MLARHKGYEARLELDTLLLALELVTFTFGLMSRLKSWRIAAYLRSRVNFGKESYFATQPTIGDV